MINEIVNGLSKLTTSSQLLMEDILMLKFTVVNAFIVETNNGWVLVDTGLETSYDFIVKCAEEYFGKDCRPKAIILTHGHFDHVGSVLKLSEKWDVPVYAHPLEIPYITGKKDYPQADPTVDEGLIAKMSPAFPHKSIDLGYRAAALPKDGKIPDMAEWTWIHTPGHTEGHVSLYRKKDGTLIAGDAFTTTKQESFMSVITQNEKIKGPPAYLTTDWEAAKASVKRLRDLEPRLALTSHGHPLEGEELSKHLRILSDYFNEISVPKHGKFVDRH